jgi:glycosyltransferase involved in cell wall biosynthesis
LVFVGRASPEKNPEGAIRIARAAGRDLKLVTKRHDPEEQDYWQECVRPFLGHDIEVLEDIDHDVKVGLLHDAYAMVFPIRWAEPFGLVMIEAMACGTPVLARPCGAAREVVEHGVTGFLYDNESDLVDAVDRVQVLDRRACRHRVEARFSAAQMARQYEVLFAQLLEPQSDLLAADASPSVVRRALHAASRIVDTSHRVSRRVFTAPWGGGADA